MEDDVPIDILLVEDSPLDADLTMRSLRKHRLANNIETIGDGAAALDFLFGTGSYEGVVRNRMPKLIMLDIKLPKLSGLEVLAAIKSNEKTRTIPVVIITSSREDPDIEKAYALGANSYVVKPIDFGKFSETISALGMYWLLINQPPV